MEQSYHASRYPAQPRPSWHRLRYAYHEAGHAVVGFWFGRSIAVLSIDREYVTQLRDGSGARLRGLCLFDIFAESEHGGWRDGPGGVNQLTILFAGTYAGMVAFHEHGWRVTHWNHGYGEDLAEIERIVRQLETSEDGQSAIKQEQEQLSLDLVLEFWDIIAELGSWLAEVGTIEGREVNQFIQEQLGPNFLDWRVD